MERKLDRLSRQMSELQYKLFASKNQSLLIILQGVDASGKDGTIRHVMGALNPQNCYVKSFKVPTQEEAVHDYLWRVHMAIPQKGQIAIFNRSHYEDIIEVCVHNSVPKNEILRRYTHINDFERVPIREPRSHTKILFAYQQRRTEEKTSRENRRSHKALEGI